VFPGTCGDGILQVGEACDDGNTNANDACTTACFFSRCGDGFVETGVELCDDGNTGDTDACLAGCIPARCGDGIIQAGAEECDDLNGSDCDDCLNSCEAARCGDGVVHVGVEECDPTATSPATCDSDCTEAICGDGLVNADANETCDDQNTVNSDGCITGCVAQANTPPIADDASVSANAKSGTSLTLTGGDPDGDSVGAFTVTVPPQHGTLTGTPPNLTYTSAPGYTGADSFLFTVSDGFATSGEGTVTLNVVIPPCADATIPVSSLVEKVVVSPDGSRAYAGLYSGEIAVINTVNNSVVATIPGTGFTFGLALSADGTRLYATRYITGEVLDIETATNTVLATTSFAPNILGGISASADGAKLYVKDITAAKVRVLNRSTLAEDTNASTGMEPKHSVVDPHGKVYVTDFSGNTVTVVDPANAYATATLTTFNQPLALKLNASGSKLYVGNFGANSVSVVSTASMTTVATISGVNAPTDLEFTADSNSLWVVSSSDSAIKVIDPANNTVVNTVSGLSAPKPLVMRPDGSRASVGQANSVKVVCTANVSSGSGG